MNRLFPNGCATKVLSGHLWAANVAVFEELAHSGQPARSALGFAVLLETANSKAPPRRLEMGARSAIKDAWKSSQLPNLLRAVAEQHAAAYVGEVRAFSNDSRPDIAAAAAEALRQWVPAESVPKNTAQKNIIAKLPYEVVVREASNASGDASLGAQLFERLACIKCHTTSKSEPLKGPFLGDITVRYKKPEIIESILRPNAQIEQGFVTTTVEMKDGSDYDGFIVRESGDELEIRNLAGAMVLAKKDIVKRGTRKNPNYAEGLADQLTPQDLASLLACLQSLSSKS